MITPLFCFGSGSGGYYTGFVFAFRIDYKLNHHRLKAVGFLAAESRIEAKAS
jgi:hypothetical protein